MKHDLVYEPNGYVDSAILFRRGGDKTLRRRLTLDLECFSIFSKTISTCSGPKNPSESLGRQPSIKKIALYTRADLILKN